ncbi:MAG: radical SAM protein [Candidatus Parcubacteria bacterium]|nr:radical SAM protein [Candidatus Parcubacteria bacterium]
MTTRYFLAIKYLIGKISKQDWQSGRCAVLIDKIINLSAEEFKRIKRLPEFLEISAKNPDYIKIFLRISRSCNQNCIFCPIDNTGSNFFSFAQLKKIIDKINTSYSAQNKEFILTGGEPTLHPDYIKLIRYILKDKKSEITVQTNAVLLSREENVKPFSKEKRVKYFVSFHSHQENIYDLITGTKDNYDLVIKGLLNVFSTGQNYIALNCVINHYNFDILEDYLKFIKQKFGSIRPLGLYLSAIGMNDKGKDDCLIKYSEVVPRLIELLDKYQGKDLHFMGFQGICGFPLCFLANYPKYFHTNENEEIEQRKKPDKCQVCIYTKNCAGVMSQYLNKFGMEEFKPILQKIKKGN